MTTNFFQVSKHYKIKDGQYISNPVIFTIIIPVIYFFQTRIMLKLNKTYKNVFILKIFCRIGNVLFYIKLKVVSSQYLGKKVLDVYLDYRTYNLSFFPDELSNWQ